MTSAEAQRIAKALESIAASLEKIANPPMVSKPPKYHVREDYRPGDIAWVKAEDMPVDRGW